MTIIIGFWIACIALALASAWWLPAVQQPTLAFGVRIPPDHRDDPSVRAARRQYGQGVRALTGIAAIGTVVLVAQGAHGRAFGLLFWAVLAVWAGVYALINREVRRAKAAQDWYAGQHQAVMADSRAREAPDRFPLLWLLPALVVILGTVLLGLWRYPALPPRLPVGLDASFHPSVPVAKTLLNTVVDSYFLIQLVVTALLTGSAWRRYNVRLDIDVSSPEASARQQRRARGRTARAWLLYAACVALACRVLDLWRWGVLPIPALWVLPATLGVAVAGALLLGAVAYGGGRQGNRLLGEGADGAAGYANRDDDRYWKGGLLYVNPDDPALWVSDRSWYGVTLNLGRPWAWPLAALVVLSFAVPTLVLN